MSGTAEPSFVSTCLEDKQNGGEGISETLIKNTAAVAYAAGVDTASPRGNLSSTVSHTVYRPRPP